ncbi:hypothetical protein IU450_32955 [Nocardia abscessus]|uniref:BRO-N domain-containing protein n=1 Tax=Nocardia abscessus TaxID=120957 RepID=UPI001893A6C7|nr:BRO family protein [Nocardia abscessus]MBF6340669.1 hypothetical protein [Nocardia abscessus]
MIGGVCRFAYAGFTVRVLVRDDGPWFALSDVCRILGVEDVSTMAAVLSPGRSGRAVLDPEVGLQEAIVDEVGLDEVLLRSEKPASIALHRWATSEVIPAIQAGYRGPIGGNPSRLEYARMLVEAEERAESARMQAIAAEEQVDVVRPLVMRARCHAGGFGLKSRQQFFREVKQWCHAERGINVKQAEVMSFLSTRKLGLFVAGRSRSDAGQATAWAIQQGYAANEEGTTDRGFNYIVGKLTPAGQAYAWERIVRFVDSTGSLALEAPARNGVSV